MSTKSSGREKMSNETNKKMSSAKFEKFSTSNG